MGINETINNNQEDSKQQICFKYCPFNQGCGVGSPVIRLRLLAISIIRLRLQLRLRLRLRTDSDLQLY